jgi:prevent-host-death family protein
MSTVNMHQAKSNLSRLVEAVESGAEHEIIIARNGKPAARLVPVQPQRKPIRLGLAKGLFEVPEDIDELNPEIERLFHGAAD